MKFRIIINLILVLISSNVLAQINIEANTDVSSQKFKIEISRNTEKLFLDLKIRDSISTNKDYQDEMKILSEKFFAIKNLNFKNDTVIAISKEMRNLAEKNTYYTTYQTEIERKQYVDFDNLVTLFETEDADFFERKTQNRNRIVFDGTMVRITVNHEGQIKKIWAHSPHSTSHPEIRNLMTTMLEIMRCKSNLSQDKRITSGF